MSIKHLFGIRRGEWWLFGLALVVIVALNALMLGYNHDLFTRGGNLAYWGLFYKHFTLSGYDDMTYTTLSNGNLYYEPYRHPLLTPLLLPLYKLNRWQMEFTDMNMAIYIVAFILVVCGVYAFVFFFRTMREVMGLGRTDSLLLTLMLYSFGHMMVATFAPDHFGISIFLLTLTLYVAGKHLREGRPMRLWPSAVLYFVTAGITLTNGVKTLLALLFCNKRQFFSWRHILGVIVLPTAILFGAYLYQYVAIQKPMNELNRRRFAEKMATDKKFAKEFYEHAAWREKHAGKAISDNHLFQWTDSETSRWDAAVENFFGESIQLHRDHLLEDTNRTRPNYVPYDHWWCYAIEAIIVALFAAGLWAGRRDPFVMMALSWMSVEAIIHFVLGFGILEVYIMAAHWLFTIPLAIAALLTAVPQRLKPWLRASLALLTLYLLMYNGTLVAGYMIR